jgi:hypothetical protein
MILTGAVALAGAGAFGGAAAVNAATTGGTSLASAIATKFGLKQADVQAVIDTQKSARQADRQQAFETRLNAAVTAGTITADQKTKVEAKVKELDAARQANSAAMQSKTPAERRAALEADRASLKQWATDNKIPENLLMMGGPGGHMGYMGGNDGAAPSGTPTPSL